MCPAGPANNTLPIASELAVGIVSRTEFYFASNKKPAFGRASRASSRIRRSTGLPRIPRILPYPAYRVGVPPIRSIRTDTRDPRGKVRARARGIPKLIEEEPIGLKT